MARLRSALPALALVLALPLSACMGGDDYDPDAEYGMNGPVDPTPPPGKGDSMNHRGLLISTDTSRTQVWTARNHWEDTNTPAAKKPGLAWGENSGLTWDEKYAAWLDSLDKTRATSGSYDTFTLTTPWGKTMPSPAVECAETAIFLRVTFAAWYELPFFMEAVDEHGTPVYFGHFGVRTQAGRYANTADYAVRYKDFSSMSEAEWKASWPHDNQLRQKRLGGGTDSQSELGSPDITFGTYVDEIHLNKRAAHFTMLALNYLGSINLADSANTYNIVPEAVRPGDTLLERWQAQGIGHTLVVKDVTPLEGGALDVTLVSGSMPRRQGKWESGVGSKRYFTDETTGGEGEASDGTPYAKMGGGLKRWRVAKDVDGFWTNTWMNADEAHWINSTDLPRIAARPTRFKDLLGQVPPEQLKAALVDLIEDARVHLRQFPASCAARERREKAFSELYGLMASEFHVSRLEVDREFRKPEDYIFAELEYEQSKTCCWNSTTSTMYEIIMAAQAEDDAAAEAAGECRAPTVFMNRADGYQHWSDFATAHGQGASWVPWSEDEPCQQRNVVSDTERVHEWSDFCVLDTGGAPGECTDSFEPNDTPDAAAAASPGTHDGLQICASDADYYSFPNGATVRIQFQHELGDLDMKAFDASGAEADSSTGSSDEERVTVPAGGTVKVFGFSSAVNAYKLIVE